VYFSLCNYGTCYRQPIIPFRSYFSLIWGEMKLRSSFLSNSLRSTGIYTNLVNLHQSGDII